MDKKKILGIIIVVIGILSAVAIPKFSAISNAPVNPPTPETILW